MTATTTLFAALDSQTREVDVQLLGNTVVDVAQELQELLVSMLYPGSRPRGRQLRDS